ncbi:terminase small subunit [Salmonella enterica subsp. enterica]|nr:terminase small subunit [Salmonella enterica subsp. enterica]
MLTDKQEAFCREYLVDLNATQAAIRAGYSEKTANRIAAQLLSKLDIQQRVSALKDGRNQRTEINADYVLRRLAEIDQMDVLDILNGDGGLRPISEWPPVWRTSISAMDIESKIVNFDETTTEFILKKIKWPDKVKNLSLLGKHVNVNAFKEVHEHNVNVTLADRMAKARKRAAGGGDD